MAKLVKVTQEWPTAIRKRPNGTYYIPVPAPVMRNYIRKLPMEAVGGSDGILVDASVTWEGLVHD